MIYLISKEQANDAVKRINESKYSLETATEVALETLRENNERVSKDVLQHNHSYGIIVPHLGCKPAMAYLEAWTFYKKGTYRQDADMFVTKNAWGNISEKRVADGMVISEL